MEPEIFHSLSWSELVRALVRLSASLILGGAIGWERELRGRSAGLRTHMLVAVGSTSFMDLAMQLTTPNGERDPTRVIQGVATGVGFLGAGVILKMKDQQRVRGLTTAASIWATAALGVVVGAGGLVFATVLALLALVVLSLLRRVERRWSPADAQSDADLSD
ncbi:MAG TPA: MgtC/SapB family protein [Polyangiales bacterium]|nr:MgtC/SapB family protein [Polyangiales bacterium]